MRDLEEDDDDDDEKLDSISYYACRSRSTAEAQISLLCRSSATQKRLKLKQN